MNIPRSIPVNAERCVHALSLVFTRGSLKYDGDTIKTWAGDSQWRAFRADLAFQQARIQRLAIERLLGTRDLSTSKNGSPARIQMALDADSFDIGSRGQVVYDGDAHPYSS